MTDLTPPELGGRPNPVGAAADAAGDAVAAASEQASDAVVTASDQASAVVAPAGDAVAAAPAQAGPEVEAAAAGVVAAAAVAAPAVLPTTAPAASSWVQPAQPAGPPPASWAGYAAAQSPRSGPAAGWEYAGFWIRAFAWIIDGVILGVITTILWTVVIGIAAAIGFGAVGSGIAADGTITEQEAAVLGVGIVSAMIFLAIMTLLVTAIYFVLLWTKRGATIGQSVLGLRVVRQADGGPIGWGASVIRYIVLYVGFAIVYLGVIWVAFDERKRGWHDLAASTYVVKRAA